MVKLSVNKYIGSYLDEANDYDYTNSLWLYVSDMCANA